MLKFVKNVEKSIPNIHSCVCFSGLIYVVRKYIYIYIYNVFLYEINLQENWIKVVVNFLTQNFSVERNYFYTIYLCRKTLRVEKTRDFQHTSCRKISIPIMYSTNIIYCKSHNYMYMIEIPAWISQFLYISTMRITKKKPLTF